MTKLAAALWTVLLAAYFCIGVNWALSGCGGSSGDSTHVVAPVYQCEHDGDVWLCNEEGSCIRDESQEVAAEEEAEGARRFLIREKFTTGPITMILECGSSVSFSNSEETEANPVTTTVTTNAGYNAEAAN